MTTAEDEDYSGALNGTNGNGHISATGMPEQPSRPAHQLPAETEEYILQVESEITALGAHSPLVRALAQRELARIKAGEISEQGYLVIHKDQPIKVVKKILIPIKEHPKINFVGRLLGPKGSTLKALQASSRARIMIFGRGSMWDKNKEEEARNSGDPKYAHLNEDLHVFIEITAYPVEVQSRFAHVLQELKKFLDPNHPGHFAQGGEGGHSSAIRPPPGMRGPPPPGFRGPRPLGPPGAPRAYGAPPRHVAPPTSASGPAPTYDTSGYYGSSGSTESAYPASTASGDSSSGYGYASYPSQSDYSSSSASGYENQAAQAQQYAAAQQQQQSYGAQPAYGQTAQPGYGQQAASSYSTPSSYGQQPGYAASAAPTGYGGAQPRPQFSAPAAKKPRLSTPYGAPGSY